MTILSNRNRLGGLLQALRTAQNLSIAKAAVAGGIHRATLYRWEEGESQPHLAELEAYLQALGANPKQHRQALNLMGTPQAQALVRESITLAAEQMGFAPMPNGGDLLQAMRHRSRLSLEEVAEKLGVATRTLRRWEKAEVWPQMEQLHALCYVLGAHEAEVIMLTVGDFSSAPIIEEMPLEALQEELNLLLSPTYPQGDKIKNLRFFAFEAQLWQKAMQKGEYRKLLAKVYALHSQLLSTQERMLESGEFADRAIQLLTDKSHLEYFWMYAGINSARAAVFRNKQPAPKRGLEILRSWLPVAHVPDFRAWIMANMAKYLALSGEAESAVTLSEAACNVAKNCENPIEIYLREIDRAGLLIKAGHPIEALAQLEQHDSVVDGQEYGETLLIRAQASYQLGQTAIAGDYLQKAIVLLHQFDVVRLLPEAEELMLKL